MITCLLRSIFLFEAYCHFLSNSESKKSDTSSKKMAKKPDVDVKMLIENGKESSKKEALRQLKDELKEEGTGRKNKEQRVRKISLLCLLYSCFFIFS